MPTAAYIGPTWFLHQTAHDERGWASDVRHCHTQRARTFHWPALCHMVAPPTSPQARGLFSFSLSGRSEKEHARERNPPLPIGSLCLWLWLLMLSADITYALASFSKDRICFNPTALWPPFWFHCLPSLLYWRSRFCWLTWQRVDTYMWEEFRNVYLLMTWVWPAFLRWPCVVDGTLKSNYYYYCTRLFCMALVEQLGDDSW